MKAGIYARVSAGPATGAKFRRSYAYHEVGHAVAAVALGLRVESVSLHPDKSRRGPDWYSAARTTIRQGENMYGDEGVIVLLAGAAAQKKHAPSSMRRDTATGDREKAESLVFYEVEVEAAVYNALFQKRWDWLLAETSKLIEANWHVIDAVATRLLAAGEISGSEVKKSFADLTAFGKDCLGDPAISCRALLGHRPRKAALFAHDVDAGC